MTTTNDITIEFPKDRIEEVCRKHHILRLSLFGSASASLSIYFRNDVVREARPLYLHPNN